MLQLSPTLKHPLRAMLALAIVMGIGYPAYLALCSRESPSTLPFLNRERLVAHVSDDAYYYFNVAQHLAAGDGPTADGVTRTTGFHPLYAFVLAGLHRIGDPSLDGFVARAVAFNGLCSLLTAGFLFLGARRLWSTAAGGLAALLWLTNPHVVKILGAGLEGSLYGMTLSLLLWRLAVLVKPVGAEQTGGRFIAQCLIVGACGGLVVLSRTDAALVMVLVAAVVLFPSCRVGRPTRIAGVVLLTLVALAVFAPWPWYAWSETGSVVQGSAQAKMAWRGLELSQMSAMKAIGKSVETFGRYVGKTFIKTPALKWVLSGIPILYLLARAGLPDRRARWMLHLLWIVPVWLGLSYAALADRPRTWYYVPGLVTLTALSAGAAVALWRAAERNRLQSLVMRTAPLLLWLVFAESTVLFAVDVVRGRSKDQAKAVRALELVGDYDFGPDTRIGCWHSGIVQYYTPNLTIINLDGLANNEILPVLRGEKTMNEYWDERGIEYVLGKPKSIMENYEIEWAHKKLIDYGPPPFGHLFRRIVPMSRLIARRDQRP